MRFRMGSVLVGLALTVSTVSITMAQADDDTPSVEDVVPTDTAIAAPVIQQPVVAATLFLTLANPAEQDIEVPLTTKEFRLLEFFVRRPGRALTRNDIMNHVWGRSVIVTSRSVDRCVTTLRGKIEPIPHHPTHIHTIRDIGYRFEPGD